MRLSDKVALITGAGRDERGIGRTIAQVLSREGCKIAIVDFNMDLVENAVESITSIGGTAKGFACDITSPGDVKNTVKEIAQTFGKIDILINNAGIARDKYLVRMFETDWQSVIDINLTGTFHCTQTVVPLMSKQRSGVIINIASIIGIIGNACQANYAASKGGVIAFTKSVAKEYAEKGIRVNAVAPGFIETAMTATLSEEVRQDYLKKIPLLRFGTSKDVANLVLFLCSDDSSYLTGQVINVDGGMVM